MTARLAGYLRLHARACGALAVVALAAAGGDAALAQPFPAVAEADAGAAASIAVDTGFEPVAPGAARLDLRLDGGAVVDVAVAYDGAHSLKLEADGSGAARATLHFPATQVDGDRQRFSLQAAAADGEVLDLFVRIDGRDGLLYVDRIRAPLAADGAEWTHVALETPVFERAASTRLSVSLERGTAWLDALSVDGVSTAALPPASARAGRYVDYALRLIDSHSIYRAALDWPAFRSAVVAQARGADTEADAHLAVRYALGALGDVHAYLRQAERAEVLGAAPVSNARTGRPPIPPEGLRLAGGIAYLTVPGFAGGTHMQQVEFAETLQSMIASLDDEPLGTCGWIVDLRRNSGGNLWPMLLGLGPLLGDGDAVFATYPDGRRETVWYRNGQAGLGDFARLRVRSEPHRLRDPAASVAVLLGADTASAAEVLAMAFRGLDGRRSFGASTDGVNSGTRTFVLPDGAELVLSVVTMSDRTGHAYRGPMQPDVAVEPTPRGVPLAEQRVVGAAVDWLAGRCGS